MVYMFLEDFFLKNMTFIFVSSILLFHSVVFSESYMVWNEFLATGVIVLWLLLSIFWKDPSKKILSSIL